MDLTAIIDWYSRYVLAWQLSNTLDNYFCLVALDQALAQAKPEIFNTDPGRSIYRPFLYQPPGTGPYPN